MCSRVIREGTFQVVNSDQPRVSDWQMAEAGPDEGKMSRGEVDTRRGSERLRIFESRRRAETIRAASADDQEMPEFRLQSSEFRLF